MSNLCFAIMPFGKKKDDKNREIEFDRVYEQLIEAAINAAGLEPVIAREETMGGFIHQPMYERLLFCKYAVTDITFYNANVFYELGIRHACRKFTTVLICEESSGTLPFDVRPLRTVMYKYDFENHNVLNVDQTIEAIKNFLVQKQGADNHTDSPIAQSVPGFIYPELDELLQSHHTPESFKELVLANKKTIGDIEALTKEWSALDTEYNYAAIQKEEPKKEELLNKKQQKLAQLEQIEKDFGDIQNIELGLVTSLLLAYRCLGANDHSVALLSKLDPDTVEASIFFQHQLAHAYGKLKQYDNAKSILEKLVVKYGNSSETCGLLGSVYKRKADALSKINPVVAKGLMRQAITAYKDGFDANPSDYYPGINYLNLLFATGDTGGDYQKYIPLVAYAIERRVKQNVKDYWASASGLELEVLQGNVDKANAYLEQSLGTEPFLWEKISTAENIERILQKKSLTGEVNLQWVDDIIKALRN